MKDTAKMAEILIQAIPHIRKNANETIVVKYGGNAMINETLKDAVMGDLVLMQLLGINVVLVHGGGPEISEMLDKTGVKSRFIDGLRVTDEETIDIVQMVLAGKVNKKLVQIFENHGGKAIGLSGLDGKMLMANKHTKNGDLGYVGDIAEVNAEPVMDIVKAGYLPIIATVAGGYDGEVYNVNADLAAAQLAASLGAKKLILMTDTKGVLRDVNDEDSLISEINVSDVPRLKQEGIISGGMIPKVDCCVEAVRRGVGRAHIIDGRTEHSILIELFSDAGIGTMLV